MSGRIARALFLSIPLFAADQVVLTNGDVITGTIVKKDAAKLTIKSEFMGEVSMPWTAVKSLKSDSDLFVQLPSGEVVKGKVATTGDRLEVAVAGGTAAAPLAQVPAIRDAGEQRNFERLAHPGLLDLWSANFDIGLALARGNARTDSLITTFTANRVTRNDKVSVYMNQIHATARANNLTSTIASAIRGGWKYNRNLTPRFFFSGFNDYEHDRFQNLDLRFVVGAGTGYKAVKKDPFNLDFDAGLDYDHEKFMNGLSRNFAEANFGNNLLFKVNKSTSVTQQFRFFANLTSGGEYRANFDLGAVTVLRKWLGWNVTASDRYLSNPVQGRQRNDLLLSTGFRLTFAR
jgi:putative salt-induced outer membrane protein YdiY